MAEAGKSLDEIVHFLRETVKNMGNILGIQVYTITFNECMQMTAGHGSYCHIYYSTSVYH